MDGILVVEVNAVMQEIAADDAVRVVVLRLSRTDSKVSPQILQCLRQLTQPIIAMVRGAPSGAISELLEACDIVISSDDPEAETYQLARDLAAKDSLALRYTKATVNQVPAISWDDILDFTTAQQLEIKALQAGQPSARAQAIESFLAGKLKPGAGT